MTAPECQHRRLLFDGPVPEGLRFTCEGCRREAVVREGLLTGESYAAARRVLTGERQRWEDVP